MLNIVVVFVIASKFHLLPCHTKIESHAWLKERIDFADSSESEFSEEQDQRMQTNVLHVLFSMFRMVISHANRYSSLNNTNAHNSRTKALI